MKIYLQDIIFPFKMILIVATFPLSVALITGLYLNDEPDYHFYIPPWVRRQRIAKRLAKEEKEREEAKKKTYAYLYLQKEYAIYSLGEDKYISKEGSGTRVN